jgi:uncharacterized SAM-binding protein YcdF (DUF218 family)
MRKMTLWIMVLLCLVLVFVPILTYDSLFSAIGNFLIVNEEPKPVDVIIVLSGGSGERVAYGVQLYHSGYADMILLTGGPEGDDITGAEIMQEQALSLGVPKDHILLEEESTSTYGNAKYTLEIMEAKNFESAILVTSPYHTRRASIIFDRFFKNIDLTICSVPYDSSHTGKWWQNRHTVKIIVSEYLKLIYYYLASALPFLENQA